MLDMTDSIVPRSDQLNAEDLLTGPRTFTIQEVRRSSSVEQPIDVVLVEFPDRPFKPSKTVRRIMVGAWGSDASVYAGRRMTLYRDPTVRFGKDEVGGIRVSHMSHITRPLTLALTVTRGKRAPYVVQPLKDEQRPASAPDPARRAQEAVTHFAGIGVTERQLTDRIGRKPSEWTTQDLADLEVIYGSLRRRETTVDEQFPAQAEAPPPPADTERRDPSLASTKQVGLLNGKLKELGFTADEDRFRIVGQLIGREIKSTKELFGHEAHDVIEDLMLALQTDNPRQALAQRVARAATTAGTVAT